VDGVVGWKIACEGARYTYLKYSKIAQATGGYRGPNWIGLSAAVAIMALAGYSFAHYSDPIKQTLQARLGQKHERVTTGQSLTSLATQDDNYQDAGVVLPVDDDGVA